MIRFEKWSAGGNQCYIYTEELEIARKLRKEFPDPIVYFRGNFPFGWQFILPERVLQLLQNMFLLRNDTSKVETGKAENSPIENKGVRGG